jgi:hypothetical protein
MKQHQHKDQKPAGDSNKHLRAALRQVYGDRGTERDVFGRRIALPSEVAQVLGHDPHAGSDGEDPV